MKEKFGFIRFRGKVRFPCSFCGDRKKKVGALRLSSLNGEEVTVHICTKCVGELGGKLFEFCDEMTGK